ncbi:MAG: D-glycero-beta-D-manno-heptose-7-phosphate kinase [Chloracidobacterium sp.]|nr:D-glycero-beta-D-manno-heptose-7-phosphate kinase [Chloracidobacterium sp.]
MSILDNFANVKILVVGDIMLDRYWWGSVKRISPEAPVPVVELEKSTFAPGGAANVAANIAGLGATAHLVGVIGADNDADTLVTLLKRKGVESDSLVRIAGRPTSVKTRVIAHSQQVVRVDQETTEDFSDEDHESIWKNIAAVLPDVDAIIVSDYAKGLLLPSLLWRLIDSARSQGKIVLVDPKGKNYSRYAGASLITPNRREAAEACNLNEDMPDLVSIAGNQLLNELDLAMVLITQGEDGMTLFQKDKEPFHLSTAAKETYDVTGAGDTVIASLGVAFGAGLDFVEAARIANLAAGLVVEQVGTTAITRQMLEPAIEKT